MREGKPVRALRVRNRLTRGRLRAGHGGVRIIRNVSISVTLLTSHEPRPVALNFCAQMNMSFMLVTLLTSHPDNRGNSSAYNPMGARGGFRGIRDLTIYDSEDKVGYELVGPRARAL